jgi:hypothetical protein
LRVYELVDQDDSDPTLEAALRHSLGSPLKKYRSGHFAAFANGAPAAKAKEEVVFAK